MTAQKTGFVRLTSKEVSSKLENEGCRKCYDINIYSYFLFILFYRGQTRRTPV